MALPPHSVQKAIVRWMILAVVLCSAAARPAAACDTPVYRYAMYRWPPAPYEVYFFHRQPAGEEDQRVQQALKSAGETDKVLTNVFVLPVDVNNDQDLARVPPDVKRAWSARKDQSTPKYVIVSPMGIEVFSGKLTPAELPALIDSPARQKMAKQLERGKAAVFILLTCGDEKADAKAEKLLEELVTAVAEGKIELYPGPAYAYGPPAGGADSDEQAPSIPKPEVAYLKVSRKDPAERWFVRQLMAVEPDLHNFVGQPMVFAVYGRGRALPPYIGQGINRDNLIECVDFVTSACSCTVKEQNPGVDLLVRYDWDAAAAAVARKFGGEDGYQLGIDAFFPEFFPDAAAQQMTPQAGAEAAEPAASDGAPAASASRSELAATPGTGADQPKGEARAAADQTGQPDRMASDAAQHDEVAAATPETERASSAAAARSSSKGADQKQVALATRDDTGSATASRSEPTRRSISATVMMAVGIGVGIALFILIGATLVKLKPR